MDITIANSAALEEREKLTKVVQGGDVLILGNRGMGKTSLAQKLERACVQANHRVGVLDSLGDWCAPSALSTRRILRFQHGDRLEYGYGRSMTTVWDYEGRHLPPALIDLAIFDDVIFDDWQGHQSPPLSSGGPRRIVLAQTLDDALERHPWRYVIAFNLSFEREIAFVRAMGGQGLCNLGRFRAQLLSQHARPEPLRIA